eukprot:TRINITY_DN8793_c0_g1_i1.p1 TRINITY_DN8793_c0_g1~~TRINITY_DN8793_c0_g1_i1.p1  ORF type:complete len:204 (-),score=24.56 TRINITY_DN8793_c0_g1_i1:38-649(-)
MILSNINIPKHYINTTKRTTTNKRWNHTPNTRRWNYIILYDGKCNLCATEINFLKKRTIQQRNQTDILFHDLTLHFDKQYNQLDPDGVAMTDKYFDIETWDGYRDLLNVMHGMRLKEDGGYQIEKGSDVFFEVYRRAGFGWIVNTLSMPLFLMVLNRLYAFWAKYRYRVTERGEVLRKEEEAYRARDCGDQCVLPSEKYKKLD